MLHSCTTMIMLLSKLRYIACFKLCTTVSTEVSNLTMILLVSNMCSTA